MCLSATDSKRDIILFSSGLMSIIGDSSLKVSKQTNWNCDNIAQSRVAAWDVQDSRFDPWHCRIRSRRRTRRRVLSGTSSTASTSCNCPTPLLHGSLSLERKDVKGISFRAEHSKASPFLHIVQLWVYVFITIYCKKMLRWELSDTLT